MSTFKPASIGKTGILSIKKNGEQVSRYRPDLGNAEIDISSAEKTTTTGQFDTITGGILQSCNVKLDINQDLHGYSEPWVGGNGKNKLPLTLANVKALNASGTWNGNVYTLNGVTFTVLTDSDDNVIGITTNGTSSAETFFVLAYDFSFLAVGTSYSMNGVPSGGSTTTYGCAYYVPDMSGGLQWDTGSGVTFTAVDASQTTGEVIRIVIRNGINVSGKTWYPMIRFATETDSTFAPYTNICSINPHTEIEVENVGKNKLQNTRTGTTEQHGLKITSNDDGSVFFHGGYTASALSAYDLSTTQDIPNGSYILNGCPSGGGGSTFQISVNDKNDTGLANSFTDTGSGANVTISNGGVYRPRVVIRQGYTIPSGGLLFKPMLRLATVTDATYTSYIGYTKTISLSQPVYEGDIDVIKGNGNGGYGFVTLNGSENWQLAPQDNTAWFFYYPTDMKTGNATVRSSHFKSAKNVDNSCWGAYQQLHIRPNSTIAPSGQTAEGLAEFKAWLANNNVQAEYELTTPSSITCPPTQLDTLVGENNLSAPLDAQSIISAEYRESMSWEDVNKIQDEPNDYVGFNLYSNLEQGAISGSDGTLVDSTARCRSNDFVEVKHDAYTLIQPSTVKSLVVFYDANKAFVQTYYGAWNYTVTSFGFNPPSTAKYMKIAVGLRADTPCTPSTFEADCLLHNIKSNVELDTEKQICKQFYGTCDTAADVAAKVVTVSTDQNFTLTTGCVVYVKFANTNSASDVTLNVNGSGDKSICYRADAVISGTSGTYTGTAGYTNQYIYTGTYWKWMGYSNELDTTYSSMSLDEMRAGTATSNRSIRADRLATVTEERIDAKLTEKLYKSGSFTSSTSASTTVTATNSAISISSTTPIDVYSDVFGLNVEAMSVSGSGTSATISITFPKTESAQTINYRVYVKTI